MCHLTEAIQVESEALNVFRISQVGTSSSFRLICFPDSAAAVRSYLTLAELLLPAVEVLIVQYPSSELDRQDPAGVARLAERIMISLEEWTDRPLALFGHRGGAEVAYRVAECLERDAGMLSTLFVSGSIARGRLTLGPPVLSCRIVAIAGERDSGTTMRGVRAWRRCTSGRFDLEVFPGHAGYLDSWQCEIANLVHDQLLSEPAGAGHGAWRDES